MQMHLAVVGAFPLGARAEGGVAALGAVSLGRARAAALEIDCPHSRRRASSIPISGVRTIEAARS